MNKRTQWKHGSYFYCSTQPEAGDNHHPDAVAIFDDEPDSPECDAIYYRKGDKFSPCRTVDRTNRGHWNDVLLAWSLHSTLEDHRNDRSMPLPGPVEEREAFARAVAEHRPNGRRKAGRGAKLSGRLDSPPIHGVPP